MWGIRATRHGRTTITVRLAPAGEWIIYFHNRRSGPPRWDLGGYGNSGTFWRSGYIEE
jgi:hypothetical protein